MDNNGNAAVPNLPTGTIVAKLEIILYADGNIAVLGPTNNQFMSMALLEVAKNEINEEANRKKRGDLLEKPGLGDMLRFGKAAGQ